MPYYGAAIPPPLDFWAGFLRPSSDVATDSWTSTPLFSKVNEATPDSAGVSCPATTGVGANETFEFECHIDNPGDTPGSQQTHTMRITSNAVIIGGTAQSLPRLRLFQGGATQIATRTGAALSASFRTDEWDLTQGEIDNITDYDDLRLRPAAIQSTDDAFHSADTTVDQVEFELS